MDPSGARTASRGSHRVSAVPTGSAFAGAIVPAPVDVVSVPAIQSRGKQHIDHPNSLVPLTVKQVTMLVPSMQHGGALTIHGAPVSTARLHLLQIQKKQGAGAMVKVENSIASRVRRGHAARAAGSVGAAAEVGRLHGESSYSTFRFKVKNKQMPWMKIPGGWEERMEGPCPRYIRLWTGDGVWSAWMNRAMNGGDSMYLTDGWRQFVDQHGVQNGDMLTFQLVGPDAWYVRIYAAGGEERPIHRE